MNANTESKVENWERENALEAFSLLCAYENLDWNNLRRQAGNFHPFL